MKTVNEPTNLYIDAAIERMEAGLDRRIRTRRTRTIAIVAGAAAAALLLTGGVVTLNARTVTSPPQALGAQQLTAADIASWTSHPRAGVASPGVVAQCKQHLAREPIAIGPQTVVGSDMRGNVQSVLVSQGRYLAECIGARGADSAFVLVTSTQIDPPAPPAATITLGIVGGNSSTNGWIFAQGALGRGVTGVTIHQDGLNVEATVAGGNWMAWWPTPNSTGIINGTFAITHADGTVTTIPANQVRTH